MGEKPIVTLLADHKFSMCSPQSCQRTLHVTQSLALPVVSTSCELPDIEKSESVGAEGYNCKGWSHDWSPAAVQHTLPFIRSTPLFCNGAVADTRTTQLSKHDLIVLAIQLLRVLESQAGVWGNPP